jgi:hypothetical protein
MKALSLTIQKIWPMLKVFADRQTDGQRDRQTDRPKNYMPPIFLYGGIKISVYFYSFTIISPLRRDISFV